MNTLEINKLDYVTLYLKRRHCMPYFVILCWNRMIMLLFGVIGQQQHIAIITGAPVEAT